MAGDRVDLDARRSPDNWSCKEFLEIPVTRRAVLKHPIFLTDLNAPQEQLESNRKKLARSVSNTTLYSPWLFPCKGFKPLAGYLSRLTTEDLELIVADHPHLATAMTRA